MHKLEREIGCCRDFFKKKLLDNIYAPRCTAETKKSVFEC